MTISKRKKNRVNVDSKAYLWWVFDEQDQTEFDGLQIKVIGLGQKYFFKYGLQQPENKRKLVLALKDYTKLIHLSAPPKFENEVGIITNSGISRMINWCKKEVHRIEYAVNGNNISLTADEKQALLKEFQRIINQTSVPNNEVVQEVEKLFQAQKGKLPNSYIQHNLKMQYHVMADAVFWEDEGFNNEDEYDLENPFRWVIHYRTFLITNHGQPSELSKSVFELAKIYFPNWIGFHESRCTYNKALADRIARIRKVSDWKVDKLFNESD